MNAVLNEGESEKNDPMNRQSQVWLRWAITFVCLTHAKMREVELHRGGRILEIRTAQNEGPTLQWDVLKFSPVKVGSTVKSSVLNLLVRPNSY